MEVLALATWGLWTSYSRYTEEVRAEQFRAAAKYQQRFRKAMVGQQYDHYGGVRTHADKVTHATEEDTTQVVKPNTTVIVEAPILPPSTQSTGGAPTPTATTRSPSTQSTGGAPTPTATTTTGGRKPEPKLPWMKEPTDSGDDKDGVMVVFSKARTAPRHPMQSGRVYSLLEDPLRDHVGFTPDNRFRGRFDPNRTVDRRGILTGADAEAVKARDQVRLDYEHGLELHDEVRAQWDRNYAEALRQFDGDTAAARQVADMGHSPSEAWASVEQLRERAGIPPPVDLDLTAVELPVWQRATIMGRVDKMIGDPSSVTDNFVDYMEHARSRYEQLELSDGMMQVLERGGTYQDYVEQLQRGSFNAEVIEGPGSGDVPNVYGRDTARLRDGTIGYIDLEPRRGFGPRFGPNTNMDVMWRQTFARAQRLGVVPEGREVYTDFELADRATIEARGEVAASEWSPSNPFTDDFLTEFTGLESGQRTRMLKTVEEGSRFAQMEAVDVGERWSAGDRAVLDAAVEHNNALGEPLLPRGARPTGVPARLRGAAGTAGGVAANVGGAVIGGVVADAVCDEECTEVEHSAITSSVAMPATVALTTGVNVAKGLGLAAAAGGALVEMPGVGVGLFTGINTTSGVNDWLTKPTSKGGLGMRDRNGANVIANTVGWGTAGAAGAATTAVFVGGAAAFTAGSVAAGATAGMTALVEFGPVGVLVGAAGGAAVAAITAAVQPNLEQRINTAIVDQGRAQFVAAHQEVDAAAAARTYNQALRYQSNVANALSTWQHNDPYGYAAAAYRYAAMHPTG